MNIHELKFQKIQHSVISKIQFLPLRLIFGVVSSYSTTKIKYSKDLITLII